MVPGFRIVIAQIPYGTRPSLLPFYHLFQAHQAGDCKMSPVTCRECGKEGILRGEVATFNFLFFGYTMDLLLHA